MDLSNMQVAAELPQNEALRILLIEDSASDIFLLKTAFEEAGVACQWQVVTHGKEAMAIASGPIEHCGFRPNLIIVDSQLPGACGLEILASLKRNSGWASTPAIIFSGTQLSSELAIAASQCLKKPNDLDGWLEMPRVIQQQLAAISCPSS